MHEQQSYSALYSVDMSKGPHEASSVQLLMAPEDNKTSYKCVKRLFGLAILVILAVSITVVLTIILLSSNKDAIETVAEKTHLVHESSYIGTSSDDFMPKTNSTDKGRYNL